jgi:hypothetical protein
VLTNDMITLIGYLGYLLLTFLEEKFSVTKTCHATYQFGENFIGTNLLLTNEESYQWINMLLTNEEKDFYEVDQSLER